LPHRQSKQMTRDKVKQKNAAKKQNTDPRVEPPPRDVSRFRLEKSSFCSLTPFLKQA